MRWQLSAKLLRRPRIQAARNGLVAAATLWRDVQSNGLRIGEQRRKIRWLEEPVRLGMDRIEGLLRQSVVQLARAARQRGECGEDQTQTGAIAGQVRDASGGALPGVTVEVTSPAPIEKVRTSTTDDNGRYKITALPVSGTYESTFTLEELRNSQAAERECHQRFTASCGGDRSVGSKTWSTLLPKRQSSTCRTRASNTYSPVPRLLTCPPRVTYRAS